MAVAAPKVEKFRKTFANVAVSTAMSLLTFTLALMLVS